MYLWEFLTIGIGSFFLSIQPNEERLKSSFIVNILKRTLPAGLLQIIIPSICFIINLANPTALNDAGLGYEAAITFGILGFSFGSIVVFIRTCWPFDKYRLGLAIAIVVIFVIAVCIDKFVIYDNSLIKTGGSRSIFTIEYDLVTKDNWWILALVCALSIPTLLLFELIANASVNRLAEKNEKFRGAIDEDFKGSTTSSK
jgi:cation-transporting ATPase E